MPGREGSQGQVGWCRACGSEDMHTDDFILLQQLARTNPFLFPKGRGASKSYILTSAESCEGNPVSIQALAGVAHQIRGPVT